MNSLDQRMNEGIDRLIALLEEIKQTQGSYTKKAIAVADVAVQAENYADYWQEKIADWASD